MTGALSLLKLIFAAALLVGPLQGYAFADPAGPATDPITGYQCLSASCTSIRLSNANCICVKQNPGATDARNLLLKCYTGHAGHWTSCPAKPRYGIMENYR
ncbi:MAG TPA: hypothetical protein VHC00_04790 [Rhizobiaceae bacterium]|nr:hypothetical protein [Rhizobiaceae bacterium]